MRIFNLNTAYFLARWTGFIGSLLTFILGVVHILSIKAYIKFDNTVPYASNWSDSVQKETWREPLFSLQPHIVADIYTPIVIGIIGIYAHSSGNNLYVTTNFKNYFLLYATIAYCGALGVIFSIVVILCLIFCFIIIMIQDADACLNLDFNFNL